MSTLKPDVRRRRQLLLVTSADPATAGWERRAPAQPRSCRQQAEGCDAKPPQTSCSCPGSSTEPTRAAPALPPLLPLPWWLSTPGHRSAFYLILPKIFWFCFKTSPARLQRLPKARQQGGTATLLSSSRLFGRAQTSQAFWIYFMAVFYFITVLQGLQVAGGLQNKARRLWSISSSWEVVCSGELVGSGGCRSLFRGEEHG